MKKYVIHGETPSKKNNRVYVAKLHKSFPNQRYVKWHKTACAELLSQKGENIVFNECKIIMRFTHGDRVKRDSDNGVNSIFDTLTDCGIIPDDNWMVVRKHLVLNSFDKGNPHCEICIYNLDERVDLQRDFGSSELFDESLQNVADVF